MCGGENQVSEHTARCGGVQTAHRLEMISSGWRRSEASRWGRWRWGEAAAAAAALWRGSIFPPLLGVPTASVRPNVYISGLKLSHHTRAKDSTWEQRSTLWNLYTASTSRLWDWFFHYCCFLLGIEPIFIMGTQFPVLIISSPTYASSPPSLKL